METGQVDNPFQHLLGAQLQLWQPEHAEFRLELQPWHLNRQGRLQGGVIATLLDLACGYSGLYAAPGEPERHGVTLSLALNFLAPASTGTVRALGRRSGGGGSVYFAQATLLDASDTLLASAQGSFKYRSPVWEQ